MLLLLKNFDVPQLSFFFSKNGHSNSFSSYGTKIVRSCFIETELY